MLKRLHAAGVAMRGVSVKVTYVLCVTALVLVRTELTSAAPATLRPQPVIIDTDIGDDIDDAFALTIALQDPRLEVIGITTAKKSPLDPSWATPRDAGIPDLDASIWVGLFAPKGTPQAIVDRINAEVRQTLNSPEVQKRFVESAGAEAVWMTPTEFLARIKNDAERYKRVVQKAGVKPG